MIKVFSEPLMDTLMVEGQRWATSADSSPSLHTLLIEEINVSGLIKFILKILFILFQNVGFFSILT